MHLRAPLICLCIGIEVFDVAGAAVNDRFLVPAPVRRIALVIGAEHYSPCGEPTERDCLPDVRNALNDAEEVARALQQAGFTSIRVVPDPRTDDEIYDYLAELVQRAGPKEEPVVIAFFFAGHGFHLGESNYILPPNVTKTDLKTHAIPLNSIISPFAGREAGMAVFFFDSCRTEASLGKKESAGFASPESTTEYTGTVQVFATQFNQTASSGVDDTARNSPYSWALRKYIPYSAPAFSLAKAYERIRDEVEELTLSKRPPQIPMWIPNANITGFYFRPTKSEEDKEAAIWSATLATGTARCVRAFKRNHPGSPFLKRAVEWLAQPPIGAPLHFDGVCPDQ